ncbi:MAG: PQQ-dependent sugar dehydrogenase, partial [Bacteroidota bacterium]
MRYLLIGIILLFISACGPQQSPSLVQRTSQEVLILRGPHADSAYYQQILAALCPLSDTGYWTIDTSSHPGFLLADTLNSYGSLVLVGWPLHQWASVYQNHLVRYLQAGGGIMTIQNQLRNRLDWPWWQQMLTWSPPDSLASDEEQLVQQVVDFPHEASGAPNSLLSSYAYQGGRVVRIDSVQRFLRQQGWATQLQRSVRYLIGDNTYDYQQCSTPQAPQDSRFTIKVLEDQDVDEPMEMTILPDGRVLFIERKGRMKLYLPREQTTKTLYTFDVCTSGNYEDGLLGLTQDPNFAVNGQIYLYYSPGPECDRPQTLSRFRLQGDSLIIASEQIILEVEVQRETCCHSGGSVAFGPAGYLWLSTGDNTSSKESDGYTPIDERPGRAPFDAQKSSGNTHDLRGKILRIALRDSGYSIPPGNLFPPDGSAGRPEIYAMGCRNPFRFSVDHQTGYLYWGDVGPDVGDSSRYGPRSYDEWNQARQAGNFGWPYFIGDNRAYPDRDFTTDTVGAFFNPIQPVNNSPFNTGNQQLPPAHKAMIWYPYALSDSFPMLGTGSRSSMAGPVYRKILHDSLASPNALPAYYEGKLFMYEWARSWIKLASFDEQGNLNQIEPFLPDFQISKPIDLEFGPDGSLYLLEYGQNYFFN